MLCRELVPERVLPAVLPDKLSADPPDDTLSEAPAYESGTVRGAEFFGTAASAMPIAPNIVTTEHM